MKGTFGFGTTDYVKQTTLYAPRKGERAIGARTALVQGAEYVAPYDRRVEGGRAAALYTGEVTA